MAVRRAARSVSRKSTPQSPPKSRKPPAVATSPTKRATRSSSREVERAEPQQQNIEQLTPVHEEHEDSINPDSSASVLDDFDDSEFESDIAGLDRDLMIEALPALYDDSVAFFKLFDKPDEQSLRSYCEEIFKPNSLPHRQFTIRSNRLSSSREYYGGETGFIRVNLVVHALALEAARCDIKDGPWRPDAALYLANIGLFLSSVFSNDADAIERMYILFPTPFIDENSSRFSTNLHEATEDLHLDFLTRFFIQRVDLHDEDPNFDADAQLQTIFADAEVNAQQLQSAKFLEKMADRVERIREYVKSYGSEPVDLNGLEEEFPATDLIFQLVKWSLARRSELTAEIKAQNGITAIQNLLESQTFERFPGEPADGHVADKQSNGEDHQEAAQQLKADLTAAQEYVNKTTDSRDAATNAVTWQQLKGKALKMNLSRFKQRTSMEAGRRTGQPQTGSESDMPKSSNAARNDDEMLEGNVAMEDEDADEQPEEEFEDSADPGEKTVSPRVQVDMIMEVMKRQEDQAQKENKPSLLHRQANAQRIPWDDESQAGPRSRPAKRSRAPAAEEPEEDDEDEEEDEDEDFEADTRATKRPRTMLPPPPPPPPPPLIRDSFKAEANPPSSSRKQSHPAAQAAADKLSPQEPARAQSSRVPSATQPSRSPLRPIRPSAAPPSTAPVQPTARDDDDDAPRRQSLASTSSLGLPEHRMANELAKQHARISRFNKQQHKMQVRTRWSEEETDRLIELIAVHDTGYAAIKREDEAHPDGALLGHRTQVNLKDKAMNIKMDYLKSGMPLPPGFECVGIRKADQQRLLEMGIRYEHGQFAALSVNQQKNRIRRHLESDDDEEDG